MTTRMFDIYIAVDWSARSVPSPAKPSSDAIWVGEKDVTDDIQKETYWRTRYQCLDYLQQILVENIRRKKRIIIGYDLDFGFPAGFVDALELPGEGPKWQKIWSKITDLIKDDETNANNRFEVAAALNAYCIRDVSEGIGPLWGCPLSEKHTTLYFKSPSYPFITKNGQKLRKLRWTETREPKAQPVWKLIGSASVGGQTLVGIPAIARLRYNAFLAPFSKIWPFETGFNAVVVHENDPFILHTEIWPGILSTLLDPKIAIRDQAQVKATVDWLATCDGTGELIHLLEPPDELPLAAQRECLEEEGWVLGSGFSKKIAASSKNYSQSKLFEY